MNYHAFIETDPQGKQWLLLEELAPCNCPCHIERGIMHMVACCHNGMIKVNSLRVSIENILHILKAISNHQNVENNSSPQQTSI